MKHNTMDFFKLLSDVGFSIAAGYFVFLTLKGILISRAEQFDQHRN
jgi:hypothetical protein